MEIIQKLGLDDSITPAEAANMASWLDKMPKPTLDRLVKLMENDLALRDEAAKKGNAYGTNIFPEHNDILRAIMTTNFDDVRAVIIGQDPYHERGQAMGLSFSVRKGIPKPKSLQNIFMEYSNDLGLPQPASGDLTTWAKNGVLLLNSTLTVKEGAANSHSDIGWQVITQALLQSILDHNAKPVVFVLWGQFAKKILHSCDDSQAYNKVEIRSSHPSPFSAYTAYGTTSAFIGSRPFSHVNRLLKEYGVEPIDWNLGA